MKPIELLNEIYKYDGGNSCMKVTMKSKYVTRVIMNYIRTINPKDEVDMRETFEALYDFLEQSRGILEEQDVNDLFMEVVSKLESIQENICPVLETTVGEFKADKYKGQPSLTKSAAAYISYVEDSFLAIDNSLRKIAVGFYNHKTEIVRISLNVMETLCHTS